MKRLTIRRPSYVCCSVLQCVKSQGLAQESARSKGVAACCSVLQCVAVRRQCQVAGPGTRVSSLKHQLAT